MTPADVQALRDELTKLMASWDYAYAFGSGCALEGGGITRFELVRQRAYDLTALIEEHSGG